MEIHTKIPLNGWESFSIACRSFRSTASDLRGRGSGRRISRANRVAHLLAGTAIDAAPGSIKCHAIKCHTNSLADSLS